jgi:catechol 2,3-dioxygenase-like lactoylglutathione lyase family enzyme
MEYIKASEVHLGIPVEDFEGSVDWYVKVLGCELVFKMGIAQLKLTSGQKIGIFKPDEDESSIWYAGDYKSHPHFSIQFFTTDIRRLRDELIASGVQVREIERGGGGDDMMMFFDPNGNRFWAIEDLNPNRH